MGLANREVNATTAQLGILTKMQYPTGGFTEFQYELNDYFTTTPEEQITPYSYTLNSLPAQDVSANYTIPSNAESAVIEAKAADQYTTIRIYGPNGFSRIIVGSTIGVMQTFTNLAAGAYTFEIENISLSGFVQSYVKLKYNAVTTNNNPRNVSAGGLRIKKITDYESPGSTNKKIRKFLYVKEDNETRSSGIAYVTPRYFYTYPFYWRNSFNIVQTTRYYTQTAASVVPLGSMWGSSVCYPNVTVLYGEAGENGKSVYTYTFHAEGYPSSQDYPMTPRTSYDWFSGQLLEQKDYEKNALSNSYILREKKNNYYSIRDDNEYWNDHYTSSSNNDYYKGLGWVITTKIPETFNDNVIPPTVYPAEFSVKQFFYLSKWQRLDSSRTTSYVGSGSDSSFSTEYYYYDNPKHIQATRTVFANSKKEERTDYVLYANDYLAGTPFVDSLVKKNAISLPVEIVKTLKFNNSSYVIAGDIASYKQDTKIVYDQLYQLETASQVPIASFRFSNKSTAGVLPYSGSKAMFSPFNKYAVRLSVSSYDNTGNPLEAEEKGQFRSAYIWDYKSFYPIAEVKNARNAEIAYTSFEADGNGNWSIGSTQRVQGGITGSSSYQLSYGSIIKPALNTSTTYTLSYWTTNTSAFTITGTQGGLLKERQLMVGHISNIRLQVFLSLPFHRFQA